MIYKLFISFAAFIICSTSVQAKSNRTIAQQAPASIPQHPMVLSLDDLPESIRPEAARVLSALRAHFNATGSLVFCDKPDDITSSLVLGFTGTPYRVKSMISVDGSESNGMRNGAKVCVALEKP